MRLEQQLRQAPSSALRLFHTVRHLKPVQVYGRVWAQVKRPAADQRCAPPLRQRAQAWKPPVSRPPCLRERWRVRLLNEDGDIRKPWQWNDPGKPKLWLYNLHYFDDLAAPADEAKIAIQRELMARWIAENPPGHGNGWEPYPSSLRVVNWIKWALAGNIVDAGWLDSAAQQTRCVAQKLEWHLLGNHLLANAKALIMAGLYFEGPEAGRWLSAGLSIYERQLKEQILTDGAHFELSPMYHAIILEDLLDVLNMARAYGLAGMGAMVALPEIIGRMRRWLKAMTHPDGGLSFFNDAAFGIAASCAELEAYAGRLGLPAVANPDDGVTRLAASGYIRAGFGGATTILDLAAIGPDYLPGHAHADTLSFEMSIGAERFIVNGGASVYAAGDLRQFQRSTAAHSTVEIGGENSSEVWASFRVARRARIVQATIERDGEATVIRGAHDGYSRLIGRPSHRRVWRFSDRKLEVVDAIASAGVRDAIARFHLGPGVSARLGADGRQGEAVLPRGRIVRFSASEPIRLDTGKWHPEFGKTIGIQTLAVPFTSGCLTTVFNWT
jgi:uncharacterized heparinase superfamily protein